MAAYIRIMIVLILTTGDRVEIDADDIDGIEAASNGAIVHRRGGVSLLALQSVRTLQARLDTDKAGEAAKLPAPKAPQTLASIQAKASDETEPEDAVIDETDRDRHYPVARL